MALRLVGAIAILASTILTATGATAEVQTITATHTYAMGDRDSKEDARVLCYMNAKRKVLEQAGVLIESASEVKNFDLTKDQITSYSAAILSIEVVKEAFDLHNGTHSLTLTVKDDVDFEEVRKRLAAIVADKGLQARVDAQDQKIRQLEEKVQTLNLKLGGISPNAQEEVRKDRDIQMAAYYILCAERGEAKAQHYLGAMYAVGKGVPKDYAQAAVWHRKAAEQGLAEAQYALGLMYAEGKGVPQNSTQAVTWFRKAAEQGDARAQFTLGWMHVEGKGVPQDYAQAVVWYRKGAEQGFAKAQGNLGVMYRFGAGVPQDYVQAHKWLNLSVSRGNGNAIEERSTVEKEMSAAQLAEAQRLAREWTESFEKQRAGK